MDTRIRKRTLLENTFEHFLVVQKLATYPTNTSRSSPQNGTTKYVIRFAFPCSNETTAQADEALYKSASLFAFPEEQKLEGIEHFTFVLTDGGGRWTFGYCRHQLDPVSGVEKCFIFLSPIPYAEGVFYKALNTCAKMEDLATDRNGKAYLQQLYTANVGYSLGRSRNASGQGQVWSASQFTFPQPYGTILPSTLDDRCLSEFYNSFTPKSMILVFASLLSERKILVTSRKLSRLSSVALALNLILYPLCWQHLFIPILPESFGDYLEAPVPFIIGVPHSNLKKLRTNHLLSDTVFVDADSDCVLSPFPQDLASLPPGIRSFLKKHLTKDRLLQGNGLARTFLRVFVKLMGNFEMALSQVPPMMAQGGFDTERFLRLSKPSRRQFLRSTFLELQMFRQFIEERVQAGNIVNSPDIFQSELEMDKPGKCMRRKLISVHYPKARFPAFLPRLQEDTHRKPATENSGNKSSNSISISALKQQQRVTCDPTIMRSWRTVVTELQRKSPMDSTAYDSAASHESTEKPLIDFEGRPAISGHERTEATDLITLGTTDAESMEESNKTIELLKKYGLYHFYDKGHKSELLIN